MNKKQKKVLKRIILCIVLIAVILLLPLDKFVQTEYINYVRFALFMIPYLVIGYDILKKALKGISNGQLMDENFLMAIATVGAIILGEYVEGVAVMLFYQIGELFQSYAVGKSRRNISDLMDIRPDFANLVTDNECVKVDPDEVTIGSIILVKPGEKIPIDGIVVEGETVLDTAALTGESVPREIFVGDEVVSGCINKNGLIKLKTTKEFGESTVSKILDLVENSSMKKSRSENFISKFAKVYTPCVCIGALLLAVIPPIFSLVIGIEPNVGTWVYRALTFLVISCPCALVISIPLSFFAGIGGASKAGILVKGSNYLETLAKTKTVVFDKTGTMTKGVFEVVGVYDNSIDKDELIKYVAHAECYSTHPISLSIIRAYKGEIDKNIVSEVNEISGKGIIAKVGDVGIAAGNYKLMQELNISVTKASHSGTILYVALNNKYAGYILIADQLKDGAIESIRQLKAVGANRLVMLTGDNKAAALDISSTLGISEVYSELLPGDKVEKLEKILNEKSRNSSVVFVGDGINDAPVLTRADIGIAMGALGSDAAIEAADVVLMDDDPRKIAKAIKIARKCIRIVYQNIYFAIGVKVICLILGAVGIANMWLAIFADVGVMVIAVLNAIRALWVRK